MGMACFRPTLLLLSVIALPLSAQAEFCAWAQQALVHTDLLPQVVVNADRETFIESKSFDEPFTVQQFWSSHREGGVGEPTVVSCKMRTMERINATQQAVNGRPPAGVERTCHDLHGDMLDRAYAAVPAKEQALRREQWSVVEEDLQFMGPKWLEPWPFKPLTRGENGTLELHTRALYVPRAWWIPMPDRFLGNYYCHLIAPDYLEALIRGHERPLF